ncbi:hypothetical protein BDZ97DRAFT_2057502 [Flammula alnicola]|nr:hypothetical protein BDZ97DRAFT_2057502 [Flammula alnicola]
MAGHIAIVKHSHCELYVPPPPKQPLMKVVQNCGKVPLSEVRTYMSTLDPLGAFSFASRPQLKAKVALVVQTLPPVAPDFFEPDTRPNSEVRVADPSVYSGAVFNARDSHPHTAHFAAQFKDMLSFFPEI